MNLYIHIYIYIYIKTERDTYKDVGETSWRLDSVLLDISHPLSSICAHSCTYILHYNEYITSTNNKYVIIYNK